MAQKTYLARKGEDVDFANGTFSGALNITDNVALAADLDLQDNGKLLIGTGDDVSLYWDGTNLIVAADADDSVIEIGDAATTQLSFDVKIYGDAANGADCLFWDASGSKLTTVGAGQIAGRVGDANGIGLTLGVKTDAGAPSTTGTPTGSVVFNTSDDKIYVYNGAAWVATDALT